jgi:hypothetical protein
MSKPPSTSSWLISVRRSSPYFWSSSSRSARMIATTRSSRARMSFRSAISASSALNSSSSFSRSRPVKRRGACRRSPALARAQREPLLQALLGLLRRRTRADDADHLVDVVDGDAQALDDVLALLGLVEQELRATADDFLAVRDVTVEQAAQVERARLPAIDHEVDDRLRRLQRRVLEELVDDDLRVLALLQVDRQPDAGAVREVAGRRRCR